MSNLKLALLPAREPDAQTIKRLQNRVYELEEQFGARTDFPPTFGLTPSEAALIGILLKRETVSHQAAFIVLYGSDADGGPANPKIVVSMLVVRLRKKLASQGIQIQTQNGVGYYLTFESKMRLRMIIEQERGACSRL